MMIFCGCCDQPVREEQPHESHFRPAVVGPDRTAYLHLRCPVRTPALVAAALARDAATSDYLSHVTHCADCAPEPIGCPRGQDFRTAWKTADRAYHEARRAAREHPDRPAAVASARTP
ncbi:hypothetical protein [Streptomyces sp. NPDC059816]|uniref:hypothetical protein n=1 Tax=Streptomyces sp. NPDC059816 TaxID=3346960 RepID=UPI0036559D51